MKIFYHGMCPDGLLSAHLFWLHRMRCVSDFLRSCDQYIPVGYDPASVDLIRESGGERVFLDYCPPEGVVREGDRIYDHHPFCGEVASAYRDKGAIVFYDPDECGASIVARVFGVDHWAVPYAKDRDLWLGQYPETRAYAKGVGLQRHRHPSELDLDKGKLLSVGAALVEEEDSYFAGKKGWFGEYEGVEVAYVNEPNRSVTSDLGAYLLAETGRTVVLWWFDGSVYHYSFRGPQSRKLAQSLGGGGHELAASARSGRAIWDV